MSHGNVMKFLLPVFLSFLLLAGTGCGTGGPGEPAEAAVTYSSRVDIDEGTGWHVVTLEAVHPGDPSRNITVKITPEGGSDMFSFVAGEYELLVAPDTLSRPGNMGVPVLYPAPNRTTDATYRFLGETYVFQVPGEQRPRVLHGLVNNDTAWQFDEPEVTSEGVTLTTFYVFDEDNPRFAAYPFKNTLTLRFTVMADRVRLGYTVENQDTKPLGFGFGVHPYWRVHGTRDDVRLQVDVPWHMEAINLYPTGNLDPTGGTEWDLTEPTVLSTLSLDDVYFGATPESEVNIFFDAIGRVLNIRATEDFTHIVVYSPDRNYVCIENQTQSTDAFNLHDRGLVEEAHLQILPAGQTTGGHIDYIVSSPE